LYFAKIVKSYDLNNESIKKEEIVWSVEIGL